MISNQDSFNLSPYIAIYDLVVPKDNMLRQINELVDFSFILEELKENIVSITVAMQCRRFVCSNIYY